MIFSQINENEYEVKVYDWIELHDDYICGHVKRQPEADEESDLRFWMFWPTGGVKPLMVGDLRRIYTFMSELNASSRGCNRYDFAISRPRAIH